MVGRAFSLAAEGAVTAGPLLLSEQQASGGQPLLEACRPVATAAQRGSVQTDAGKLVPRPGRARQLQALPLAAGGASLSRPLSPLGGPPQGTFGGQRPRLLVTWPTVQLCGALRGALPPGGALLLGGPATCSPSHRALFLQLQSLVCHARCGL